MAQYGGEQCMKQEGHQTDEHVQNQLHSTTAGHDVGGTGTNMGTGGGRGCKEGKQGVVEKIKEKLPGGDHGVNEHMTHDTTTGQNIGGTGTNMGMGGGNGCKEGKQGVVEKIKEKMPGGDHGADKHTTHASDTVGGGEYGNVGEEGHEKKGLSGKIKDKLPGGGNQ